MFIYNDNKGRLGNSLFRLFANIVFLKTHSNNTNDSQIMNKHIYCKSTLVVTDNYFICWMNKLLENIPLDKIDANANVRFDGYYQHDKIFVKYKEDIIRYIETHPELHRLKRKMRQNAVMIYIFYNYVSNNLLDVPL